MLLRYLHVTHNKMGFLRRDKEGSTRIRGYRWTRGFIPKQVSIIAEILEERDIPRVFFIAPAP